MITLITRLHKFQSFLKSSKEQTSSELHPKFRQRKQRLTMYSSTFVLLALSSIVSVVRGTCGGDIPDQPQPGQSQRIYISVSDPNFGEVERSFVLHLPAGYSDKNDISTPLVLSFHGWHGNGNSQEYEGGLNDVADEDQDGGFIVVHGDGYGDPSSSSFLWGSWNCTRTDGPLGPPCVLPRPLGYSIHCYDTCIQCDPKNSCDWSHCFDDEVFVRAMVEYVKENYCLDIDSIHMTGISAGGQFSYSLAAKLNDIVASIAPNAADPMIGFGDVPLYPPVSLIDFHGNQDTAMPYDINSFASRGEGPYNSVISLDYYYYEQKPDTINKWASKLSCLIQNDTYPTDMDGIDGWACNIWSDCLNAAEIVHCTGDYGHNYPFPGDYIGGTRIMWEFMKHHRKN